jgi:hypothetical protein
VRQSVNKSLILLLLTGATLLSGCATGNFENRLVMTAAGDELLVVSKYGPFGISSELSKKDLEALKKAVTGQ